MYPTEGGARREVRAAADPRACDVTGEQPGPGGGGGGAEGARARKKEKTHRLRVQRHARHEGGGHLQHVLPAEVLWCGADGHARLEHLEADLAPGAHGVEADAAVGEQRREVAPVRLERVGADDDGARLLVLLEEGARLGGREEAEEEVHELAVVAVDVGEVLREALDVLLPGDARRAQPAEVGQRGCRERGQAGRRGGGGGMRERRRASERARRRRAERGRSGRAAAGTRRRGLPSETRKMRFLHQHPRADTRA